ncbi:MAG: ABC transporter permease [Hominilimicola sp.]
MIAIFKREFHSMFTNITGYIFCAFILLFAGIYMTVLNLKSGYANFEYVLGNMGFIFLIAIPVLTMRSVAEERKQKTDSLLYSLPVSMTEVVLGKFLAMLAVLFVPLFIIGFYPLILSLFGNVHLPASYGSIIGFFFLGGALSAIGLFISSLTENQVVSAVLCLVTGLINYYLSSIAGYVSSSASATAIAFIVIFVIAGLVIYILTKNPVTAAGFVIIGSVIIMLVNIISPDIMSGLFPKIMDKISLFERFYNFPNGVFDISALIYFIVVMAIFLFFTVQSMEKRRWS